MNPFPLINDKSAATITVHTVFPRDGYTAGDYFAVQHGPDKANLYVFEVLSTGRGGRAERTRMVSNPLFHVSADGNTGLYVGEMATKVEDQPEVVVSGDLAFGIWIIRWLMDLALAHPGTIGAGFVDARALKEYVTNSEVMITHRESASVHQLQFTNGSFVRLFNLKHFAGALSNTIVTSGERFNFVGAFNVTDEVWSDVIIDRCTRHGPHAKWRIRSEEPKAGHTKGAVAPNT